MDHGQKLKWLRNRLALTQIQMSKKLRVTQVSVSAWETNVRHPSPKYVNKLLKMAELANLEIKYEDLRPE